MGPSRPAGVCSVRTDWGFCNMRSTWRNFCQVEIKGAAVASSLPKVVHKKPLKAHVVKVKRQIRNASKIVYNYNCKISKTQKKYTKQTKLNWSRRGGGRGNKARVLVQISA